HLYSLGNAMNTGLLKFKPYLILNIISMVLYILILLVIYFVTGSLNVYISSILFIPFCGVIVFTLTSFPYLKLVRLNKLKKLIETEQLKCLLKYFCTASLSVFLAPIVLMVIRNSLIDNYGVVATGNWQAMWRVSEIYTTVITLGLSAIVLPKLARASNYIETVSVLKSVIYFAFPVLLISVIFVYFGKGIWLPILYSDEFSVPNEFLIYQLPGDILKVGCWLLSYLIISKQKLKLYASLEVSFSLTFALLTLFSADLFGMIGVPLAYLVTQLLCLMLLTWWFYFVFKKEQI
ncbi:hypothetical protein, partial [Shewanella sp. c952]|uniref:hypothetical protein n=1 Tax=Shewanella sp. c952 TaxID=2815913 RepID=UPI001C7CC608